MPYSVNKKSTFDFCNSFLAFFFSDCVSLFMKLVIFPCFDELSVGVVFALLDLLLFLLFGVCSDTFDKLAVWKIHTV